MQSVLKSVTLASGLVLASVAPAAATPMFQDFGPLPEATFGGMGIPTAFVAIATADLGMDNTATLGLSAARRSPSTISVNSENDGAGTFTAPIGTNLGNSGTTPGALWNINFYADIGDATFDNYRLVLGYEFDTAIDTTPDGELDVTAGVAAIPVDLSTLSTIQGSQNLLFSFFSIPSPIVVTPSGVFDPNATGEYTLSLSLFADNGQNGLTAPTEELLARVAIDVQVVSEPATLGLLGTALVGMAALRRRRKA